MPVILMTAQATLQSAMQAVNEGAFYYIQKPFRNDVHGTPDSASNCSVAAWSRAGLKGLPDLAP